MVTFVLSAPGRRETSDATIAHLARQNPYEAFGLWPGLGADQISDFWRLLSGVRNEHRGADLLVLEDDIRCARNFIAYARQWHWSKPAITSFFNGRGFPSGLRSAEMFGFTQAVKIPSTVLELLVPSGPNFPRPVGRLADDALAWELQRLGVPVFYHPSLVQHVGADSLVSPGEGLQGRTAADFVGEDFDCLSAPF